MTSFTISYNKTSDNVNVIICWTIRRCSSLENLSSVASMNFLSNGKDFDEESLTRRNNKKSTPIRQFLHLSTSSILISIYLYWKGFLDLVITRVRHLYGNLPQKSGTLSHNLGSRILDLYPSTLLHQQGNL